MSDKRIFLVRHGLSEGNVDKTLYGKTFNSDIKLTERGKEDSRNAAKRITDLCKELHGLKQGLYDNYIPAIRNFDEIHMYFAMFHSPYARAAETADIIDCEMNQRLRINQKESNPLIREREWGNLRHTVGQLPKYSEERDKLFHFFRRPEGGESFADTYQRALLFDMWMTTHSRFDNNIVVAHGEFNKVYMMYLLGWTIEEFEKYKSPKNGEVFLIENGRLSKSTPLTLKIKTMV